MACDNQGLTDAERAEGANLIACISNEPTSAALTSRERSSDASVITGDVLRVGAHLEGANLSFAHLDGANLNSAHLEGAILVRAYLKGADFTQAHLERVVFSDAHLEGADLTTIDRGLAASSRKNTPICRQVVIALSSIHFRRTTSCASAVSEVNVPLATRRGKRT